MRRKWLFMAVFVVGISASAVLAEGIADVAKAELSLNSTLVSLKQSVARLSLENEEITRFNETLRAQIKNAEEALKVLQRDEAKTQEQYQALEATYQQKRAAVQALENEAAELDKTSSDIDREVEQVLAALKAQEDEEARVMTVSEVLIAQISDLRQQEAQPRPLPAESGEVDQQKLVQDLSAAEALLGKTKEEWLGLQRLIEGGQGQVDLLKTDNTARRVRIQKLSDDLEKTQASLVELDGFIKRVTPLEADTATTLPALEQEVRGLSDEVMTLQREMARLDKEKEAKARKSRNAKDEGVKKNKVTYRELKIKNASLRDELKKLRQSMVALDKKKSVIEKQIYRR